MSLVDRKFFVTEKPYEDSSQPTAYGVKILAPHVDALVLGALESRLQHSGHVSCILCHGGYLPSVMALYVTNTGIIVGIEKDGRVTNLNYNNIEKWIKSSEIAQKYRLFRHLPFKFYTRSNPGDEVLSIEFSATFYNGDDKNTIVKLKQRLKRGGRLVYLKSIGKEGQTLMVIDRRSNGSFYERLLARVRLDGKMEESLEEMEETLTPQPVPPPFADFDDILISLHCCHASHASNYSNVINEHKLDIESQTYTLRVIIIGHLPNCE
uniref:protein-L-isoaspartate(D-aspartate) O-methyltransferase n=1 Tax=Trichobilharzia regenti TaxID=157069 RepID=A0AA85IY41_TRIRE|nr:unnamed protein product [Trichobilharzia regenti]